MSSQHGLAAVAEARRLDGGGLQGAAKLVDDERGKRLALDVLGDDDEGLLLTGNRLENRQEVLHVRDLLLDDEDVGIFDLGHHALRVGDEVGREVAAVELHALDDVELRLEALGLFDGDDAFLADLLHGLGDDLTDGAIAVGADRADLRDLLRILGGLRELLELLDDVRHAGVDAALDLHRVVTRGDHLGALADNRLRKHGGGGGAVARDVGGLRSDLAHHLGAHVLELVGELDLLGDRDAVLGDGRCAEALLDHDVAALGTERDFHGIRQRVDAGQNAIASSCIVNDLFRSHVSQSPIR